VAAVAITAVQAVALVGGLLVAYNALLKAFTGTLDAFDRWDDFKARRRS
jgi:hypothetical protein